jgi:intracellular sulfur oxidation DsrE/DsrF family protein
VSDQLLKFLMARRSFLTRVGAGAFAGTAVQGAGGPWQPGRHALDDWMDHLPGSHRLVFDTTTAEGLAFATQWAGNFLAASKAGYGLEDGDSALIVVVRHKSTAYGYNEALWTKYRTPLTDSLYESGAKPASAAGGRTPRPGTIQSLAKRGVHFAICQMASRRIAGELAAKTGAKTDDIFAEISANLVVNGHLAAAGIVAVNRAQERGYTLVTAS